MNFTTRRTTAAKELHGSSHSTSRSTSISARQTSPDRIIFNAFLTATALLAITLFSIISASADSASLNAKEIRGLFPGKYEARVDGHTLTISAKGNGTLKGSTFMASDSGRWWLKGSSLCVEWKSWADGETMCGKLSRVGNWYTARAAGKVALKFRPYVKRVASAEITR